MLLFLKQEMPTKEEMQLNQVHKDLPGDCVSQVTRACVLRSPQDKSMSRPLLSWLRCTQQIGGNRSLVCTTRSK